MRDYRYKKTAINCMIWTEWTFIVFTILINFLVLANYFKLIGSDKAINEENIRREKEGLDTVSKTSIVLAIIFQIISMIFALINIGILAKLYRSVRDNELEEIRKTVKFSIYVYVC